MKKTRLWLITTYLTFILIIVILAVFFSNTPPGMTFGRVSLIILWIANAIIVYQYTLKTQRKPIFYVLGTLIMPFLIPLILALLPLPKPLEKINFDSNSSQGKKFFTTSPDSKIIDDQFSLLKSSSYYLQSIKIRKPAAISSIVMGIVTVVICLASVTSTSVAIAGFLGFFLIMEGIWLLFTEKISWLIIDGITILGVGVSNILFTIMDISHLIESSSGSGRGLGAFIALGIWQIIYGFKHIGKYNVLSKENLSEPSLEIEKKIDDIVKEIIKTDTKQKSDLIEFKTEEFIGGKSTWKGRLTEKSCIFVMGNAKNIIFQRKKDVQIYKTGKILINKPINAKIKIQNKIINCKISHTELEKYKIWENHDQSNAISTAPEVNNQLQKKSATKEDTNISKEDKFFNHAKQCLKAKDWKHAIANLTKTIHHSNKKAHVYYYYRGMSAARLKDYNNAIDDISQAIAIFPKYWQAYNLRYQVRMKLGNKTKAKQDLDMAFKINPNAMKKLREKRKSVSKNISP